ncbi:MAG: GYF domain-containing protein [Bacteriovoracales bacterium]|nr:GYF domain-containing protein [Bacteriovoracales bacterium]
MGTQWFYVEDNEKVGPVGEEQIISFIKEGKLSGDSYVWTTGFENWKKLLEVDSLKPYLHPEKEPDAFDWDSVDPEEKIFFIMIGKDRGAAKETLYGPYSLEMLHKLYLENRINGHSWIWTAGLSNWKILGEIEIFERSFGDSPPEIDEIERRSGPRRPFVARLFLHNNSRVFEGICRDISVGGMQILVAGFPAQLGEHLSFNVHPDNRDYHFVASGEVVRVLEGDQGLSLRFTDIGKEAKAIISKYVSGEL